MQKPLPINSFQSIESIEAEIQYHENKINDSIIESNCINNALEDAEAHQKAIFKLKTKKAGLGPCSLSEK